MNAYQKRLYRQGVEGAECAVDVGADFAKDMLGKLEANAEFYDADYLAGYRSIVNG